MKDKMSPKWTENESRNPKNKEKAASMEECMDEPMMHDDMTQEDRMGEKTMHDCSRHMMLAHAYVPWQVYKQAFCPPEALMKGTLFPELWGVYPIPE
ncbi:MAG TPA: spore coat associated protein CotJA [Selenomonadales bacterium]|nr:spore coat associated protein CotJA [Selenomonadales bacterium]